jgi:hypothetical protein
MKKLVLGKALIMYSSEVIQFLAKINDLIKSGTVKTSELFLNSIAQTVRDQDQVTEGQRIVVDQITNGTDRSISRKHGRRKFEGFTPRRNW